MTSVEYHLVLTESGGHLFPQLSSPNLRLTKPTKHFGAGWTNVTVEVCSRCLTILRRHEELSLAWPLPTDLMMLVQSRCCFPLCDTAMAKHLKTTGHLKRS